MNRGSLIPHLFVLSPFSHANRLCANDLFFAMRMIVEYFQKSVADIQEKKKIPTVIKATPLD